MYKLNLDRLTKRELVTVSICLIILCFLGGFTLSASIEPVESIENSIQIQKITKILDLYNKKIKENDWHINVIYNILNEVEYKKMEGF